MPKPHAIIVGPGATIGLGLAEAFALEGFTLSLLSRNCDRLRDNVLHLVQQGTSTACIPTNTADHRSLTASIREACRQFGDAEVLVFNVFASSPGKPSALHPDALSADFHINVSGALACVQSVLPAMLRRKSGTILLTGGWWAYPSVSIHKMGLCSLAWMLADELRDSGVRAGTVTSTGDAQSGARPNPSGIVSACIDLCRCPTESFPVEWIVQSGAR